MQRGCIITKREPRSFRNGRDGVTELEPLLLLIILLEIRASQRIPRLCPFLKTLICVLKTGLGASEFIGRVIRAGTLVFPLYTR